MIADPLSYARALLERHGLHDWTVGLDRARTRLGNCREDTRSITISRTFAERATESDLEQVLLHEIAHALVGARHGHDGVWLRKAREIGLRADQAPIPPELREYPPARLWPGASVVAFIRGEVVAARVLKRNQTTVDVDTPNGAFRLPLMLVRGRV
ncbi:MAG TPA: SprT-like domain-containing protein [Microbacteriaceae bacterium]|nr:SprT-like domain-containing protein [Microbacteriaceae bacterium]